MPKYIYTDDKAVTHPIRLDAATATAGSFTATGTATSDVQAKVSKSDREFGLRPRGVRLSRNLGSETVPNLRYKFLPVATLEAYNGTTFDREATVTIGSVAWTVVSRSPEDY